MRLVGGEADSQPEPCGSGVCACPCFVLLPLRTMSLVANMGPQPAPQASPLEAPKGAGLVMMNTIIMEEECGMRRQGPCRPQE